MPMEARWKSHFFIGKAKQPYYFLKKDAPFYNYKYIQ
jgi:hypothetical protein